MLNLLINLVYLKVILQNYINIIKRFFMIHLIIENIPEFNFNYFMIMTNLYMYRLIILLVYKMGKNYLHLKIIYLFNIFHLIIILEKINFI